MRCSLLTFISIFIYLFLCKSVEGHCCSLFPHHPLLFEVDKLITHITDSPKPPSQRITFTLPLVNKAAHCWFVITGKEKQEAFTSVIERQYEGLPSARVRGNDLQFFVDSDVARGLKQSKL